MCYLKPQTPIKMDFFLKKFTQGPSSSKGGFFQSYYSNNLGILRKSFFLGIFIHILEFLLEEEKYLRILHFFSFF